MIFIDTNVLIDIVTPSSPFNRWSIDRYSEAMASGPVAIDQIILAEIAHRFDGTDAMLAWVGALALDIRPLTDDVAHRAGHAMKAYRDSGGARTSILADFLIAAHAAAMGARLLTRDRRRFSRYFPELALITPESQP